jgi:chromosome condensin MukBEF ATPase and DNA-binding subunit MukB
MKSILNLFKPTQTEVAIREDISRGREKPKPSTVLPGRQSTSSTLGGSELEQLRASLQDMDARLQSAIGERDALRLEFNDYRQAANEDANDLERTNRELQSRLRETGQQLSAHIASRAQLGPLPDMAEDSTPEGRTEAAYMRLARQLKGDTTGANPQRIERP